MNGRKRTVQIKFRVTEAERDLILEKMKLIPTDNMAAYLRKIAIDGYIIQVDHTDIKDKGKYKAAHESDIILFETAARAIKAAGISKLPSVPALQSEYTKLQEQKEALYADYGKLKKQVREYDVIKRNVDSILRVERQPERERNTQLE